MIRKARKAEIKIIGEKKTAVITTTVFFLGILIYKSEMIEST